MPIVRAVAKLAARTGLPRDDADLTFHYSFATTPGSSDYDNLAGVISFFLNAPPSGHTDHVRDYISQDRDTGTGHCHVVFYLMPSTPGPTGAPVHTTAFTFSGGSIPAAPLPDQDAACLSFHADLTGAVHPRRLRGRVFLGPLGSLALEEGSGGIGAQSVSSNFLSVATASAHAELLLDAASFGWTWVVFSRVDWAGHTVVGGYMDDRFDTQRRRLQKPSGRVTF